MALGTSDGVGRKPLEKGYHAGLCGVRSELRCRERAMKSAENCKSFMQGCVALGMSDGVGQEPYKKKGIILGCVAPIKLTEKCTGFMQGCVALGTSNGVVGQEPLKKVVSCRGVWH
jgi:hypothetical protein